MNIPNKNTHDRVLQVKNATVSDWAITEDITLIESCKFKMKLNNKVKLYCFFAFKKLRFIFVKNQQLIFTLS